MNRARIAVFSPVRPIASGISDYCEESLSLLWGEFDITLFLDGYQPASAELSRQVQVEQAADCETLHEIEPFAAFIYHLGNAPVHEYLLPYIERFPGLLILHDSTVLATRLHTALKHWQGERFRAEMAAWYGTRGETAAEIILTGLHNDFFLRRFTLTEPAVRASRITVVHDAWSADELRRANPGARVEVLPHYVRTTPIDAEIAAAFRARWGIPPGRVIIGTLGLLTPEKGIGVLIETFSRLIREGLDAHLLLAGPKGENLPLDEMVSTAGCPQRITVTGPLAAGDLDPALCVCDIVVQLRWPTRRESSAIVMRALALGRAVVSSDLAHLQEFPQEATARVATHQERESLYRVLKRLVLARPERERLGSAAKAWIAEHADAGAVRARWRTLIAETIRLTAAGSTAAGA